MMLIEPIAAAIAAVTVLGGAVFIGWAVLECVLGGLRFLGAAGQRTVEEDPHG